MLDTSSNHPSLLHYPRYTMPTNHSSIYTTVSYLCNFLSLVYTTYTAIPLAQCRRPDPQQNIRHAQTIAYPPIEHTNRNTVTLRVQDQTRVISVRLCSLITCLSAQHRSSSTDPPSNICDGVLLYYCVALSCLPAV